MSTTDSIPSMTHRNVTTSFVGFAAQHGDSVADATTAALSALSEWARAAGADAVVGVQLTIMPEVSGHVDTTAARGDTGSGWSYYSNVSGATRTVAKVVAYGTAIVWEPLPEARVAGYRDLRGLS